MVGVSGALYVEGRVERLNGGRASYVDPRSIRIAQDGTVDFETLSSGTSTVTVQLGIGMRF